VNKCLEMYLRCFTSQNPKAWSKLLPWAELWYNTAFHTSIGMCPFRAVYGRDPPMLIKYDSSPLDPPSLQTLLQERDKVLALLKENLSKAQQTMKKFADSKRRVLEFQVGDHVLVKLQPYRQYSIALQRNQKLGLRYFGPFQIIAKIGPVAYKLLLPPTAKIHPVFHVSALKPCKGEHNVHYLPLPLTTNELGPILMPQTIIQSRVILQQQQQIPQVLVQWEGLPRSAATWENWSEFQDNYPNLNLEDKVSFNGGSNVMIEINHEGTKDKIIELEANHTNGQVAIDPPLVQIRRSVRERKENRKYSD
ncbi:hypothetical protein KIW84_024371, partial [Lathyrus oleraceus]